MDRFFRMTPRRGFTLAEMLIVLMIVSLIATAAIPFSYKRIKMAKDKTPHGKYECFRKANGDLVQKRWDNNVETFDTEADAPAITECTFNPPTTAAYFIVQAVGAGGGGAWSGAIGNAVTQSQAGTITVPIDGNPVTSSYGATTPAWITTAIDTDATNKYTVNVTAYGGGGGGGAGSTSAVNWDGGCSELLCSLTPKEFDDGPPATGCCWFSTDYSGRDGGAGGSVSIGPQVIRMSTTIKATGGSGGGGGSCGAGWGSSGGAGTILVNNVNVGTSGYGTGGQNATSSGSGVTTGTTVAPGSGGGAGGSGSSGMVGTGTGKPPNPSNCKTGGPGTGGGAAITAVSSGGTNNGSNATFPFSFSYVEKTMPYAEGGKAGEYKTMFFRKLSGNLVIQVGRGGLGGTATSPDYNKDGTTTVGEGEGYYTGILAEDDEFSTTIGTFLKAQGGAGGKTQYTKLINLYDAVSNASYFSNYLIDYKILAKYSSAAQTFYAGTSEEATYPAYTVVIGGKEGDAGGFLALSDPQGTSSPDLDKNLGKGGRGGGSTSGVGYSMTALLSGNSYSPGTYPSGSAPLATTGAAQPGSPGKSGAVVILW